jgi:hypothetical protein
MSRTYTTWVPEWLWRRLDDGPLRHVWGWNDATWYPASSLAAGDRLVAITVHDGLLYLLGGMTVAEVRADAEVRGVTPPRHAICVVVGEGEEGAATLRFDRAFPPGRLADWRFRKANGAERPLRGLVDRRIHGVDGLAGCHELARPTAELVRALVDEDLEALPPEPGRIAALIRALRAAADDRETAVVLADAWLEADDPRGEVLLAELELAERWLPTARIAAERLDSVVRRHADAVLGRPGGFPFRAGWAPALPRR